MATDSREQAEPKFPEVYQRAIRTILAPYNVSQKGIEAAISLGKIIYGAGKDEGKAAGLRESNDMLMQSMRPQPK
ncbi:MAG: hypothetical protein KKF56_02675 [Nanoarchaeota archaeon]|nr:hypothetical protein [Nanoarchaeota archaeon]